MKVLLNYSNLNAFIDCFELLSSTQQENKSLKWDGYTHSISMSSCIITYQRWSPELTGKFSYVKTEFKRNVITKNICQHMMVELVKGTPLEYLWKVDVPKRLWNLLFVKQWPSQVR